jgi:hypothetical protein
MRVLFAAADLYAYLSLIYFYFYQIMIYFNSLKIMSLNCDAKNEEEKEKKYNKK